MTGTSRLGGLRRNHGPLSVTTALYDAVMIDRWKIFESRFGRKARASDAAWYRALSPTARVAIVEDLYATAREVHEGAADWSAVEDLAWQRTLAERRQFVAAIHSQGKTPRRRTSLADAG